MHLVEQALQFSRVKHIPYMTNPVAVAMILKEARFSDNIVAAGLLHDAL